MTIRFPSPAVILFLSAATAAPIYAPEWTDSLPFVATFRGEVVTKLSSPGGDTENRAYQDALLGVDSSPSNSSAGSAWHWIKTDFRNDYEVTHFDGAGGAVRMAAKQCPPPDPNTNVQSYDDPAGVLSPCQCSIDITPAPVEGCTLPAKFSCLDIDKEDGCVPTEGNGCPLSEFVQRREWNYAPPTCSNRTLVDGDFADGVAPSDMPWNATTNFAVCESRSGMSSQIEAIHFDAEGPEGVPVYDMELLGTSSHQSSSKTWSYLVNMGTHWPSNFFLDDPVAFLNCLSAGDANHASDIFCNNRGVWKANLGNQPFPFSCDCDDPWTGDRCDVQASCPDCHEGTSGPCQHNTAGDTSCTKMNSGGSCPTGYSLCF
eukprot:CAMPEP_0197467346 /NCGR_PEP_ID=MMETSP1175-20131217/65519_1 /TAXON_ID=1003142 /ORGANISM="Triceratium dubium, Strain CCMP147" /LENGTH=372 /DNA_ID=CAMNT_0043003415 /DNA_START=570 /DNA_END=1688 /DNA_ORIENTATION=+